MEPDGAKQCAFHAPMVYKLLLMTNSKLNNLLTAQMYWKYKTVPFKTSHWHTLKAQQSLLDHGMHSFPTQMEMIVVLNHALFTELVAKTFMLQTKTILN